VRVDSVDIDLAAGRGTIRSVRVANPEGYSDADAISLAEIELAIDARSVGEQPFRITRVRVGDSVVNFEVHDDGGSNIEQITRHITGSDAKSRSPRQRRPAALRDRRVRIRGRRDLPRAPGREGTERVHMPGLEMSDLGGQRGATGGEIGEQIARAFTRRVVAATAGHQVGRAVEKELGEAAGDAAETILRHVLE
jgi:hypothetical protein